MGAVWFGVSTAAIALRPSFLLLVVGVGLAFASVPIMQTSMTTVFHQRVPASMQGRVFGLRSGVGLAFGPIGSLSGGAIAERSEAAAFASLGMMLLAVGLVVGLSGTLRSIDNGKVSISPE